MRLIDGSEFFIQACRTFGEVIGLDEVAELLDKMPTVEAIPVEWLNEYAHKLIKLEKSQPVAYRWFSVLGENILQMIHDWRKENETKTN